MAEWWNEEPRGKELEEEEWLDWGEDWGATATADTSGENSVASTTYIDNSQPAPQSSTQGVQGTSGGVTNLEEVPDFVTLIQLLKEPFDFLAPYMGGSLFFNLMKLNFELTTDRIARAYLMERQQRGNQELPPEMERAFVELLIKELKSAENRIWDYILWLREVVEAKKRQEEEPPPPDWLFDIYS